MTGYKFLTPKKKYKTDDPFAIQNGRFKEGKLPPYSRIKWAEETYIAESRERETVGRNFKFSKLPIIGAVMLSVLLLLIGKTAWLQMIKGDYYYSMAEGNRLRIERIEPQRGVIYDIKMRALVRNQANFLLYVIPADLPAEEEKLDPIINRISEIIEVLSSDDIERLLANVSRASLEAYRPLFILDNIEYETAMKLYLGASQWPGVVLTSKSNRDYFRDNELAPSEANNSYSLSHILGYTGKINEAELKSIGDEYLPIDYIGKMGIEYFWENELKGKSGQKQIEVDALGKEKKIIGQVEAEDGHNLVLSVDLVAQTKLETIIRKHLKKLNLSRVAAVLMNPQNGEVVALVSLPAFDNNQFARGISTKEYNKLINHEDKPLFNRAVSGEYPSGSIIKPVLAAAALEEGIITETTTFLSVGGIQIGQWFFPDWRSGGHGRVSVRRAIAESVNTFFYYIGGGYEDFRGLGVDKINHYGALFGLGTQTGIDLAGEASGFLPTRSWKEEVKGERWYIGDTYHLAIGQGDLLVTPLQVAAFTSVFANGGSLYRPHFVKQILTSDDNLWQDIPVEPIREKFISPYYINVVREGMRQTVTDGSARNMNILPIAVAGKTGTAQWSSQKPHHAWFTGFAPYDEPELTITILVEQGGEGSETAVPIAREFLNWYFGEYKIEENTP